MPAFGIASMIDLTAAPWMKKPPAAVKLLPWKLDTSSTTIVTQGMMTFHHVSALLIRASHRIPIMLTTVNSAISAIATTRPVPWTTPFTNQPCRPL